MNFLYLGNIIRYHLLLDPNNEKRRTRSIKSLHNGQEFIIQELNNF